MRIRRALISVSDKSGIVPLAEALVAAGIEILSTGGTARALRDAGVAVTDVSDVTGFPEIMDGRVKTLHPKIHGGLLGRRGTDDEVMREHGIDGIDLLVVNLYPFAATINTPGTSTADAIEQIDIGGPAMIRAAAKNHADVAVVVDPADYPALTDAVAAGDVPHPLRRRLAARAFAHTAAYDGHIADYLGREAGLPLAGAEFALGGTRIEALRYGENPHQAAAFYADGRRIAGTLAAATMRQGKALSYNNIADVGVRRHHRVQRPGRRCAGRIDRLAPVCRGRAGAVVRRRRACRVCRQEERPRSRDRSARGTAAGRRRQEGVRRPARAGP